MYKLLFVILIFFIAQPFALSQDNNVLDENVSETINAKKIQFTNYKDCIRAYKLHQAKLFFLALSSISANKYEITEIQSRSRYILFKVDNKEFLIDIIAKDKYYSYIKITPADNSYYFSPEIPTKIFNYIDLNFNTEIKELKI